MKNIEVPYSKTLTKAMPLATRHLIKCVPASAHTRRQEVFMSWEQRGSQRYYYRVRYHQGQLTKTYYGTGAVAQRAAEEDNHKRTLRQQERSVQQYIQSLETQLTALTHVVRTFVA